MIASETLRNREITRFAIERNPLIHPNHRLFFLGSCFSEEICNKLNHHFFDTYGNPYGTLFTVDAILKNLQIISGQLPVNFIQHENKWHFLEGASMFQHEEPEILKQTIEEIQKVALNKLKNAQFIFITLGSSYYYQWLESGKPVANCHKIPQKMFQKKRFTVEELVDGLEKIHRHISKLNPQSQMIFTISPVRHLKDGIRENVLSKSILQVGLDHFLQNHPEHHYFPSFEIAQEELRDHRYFKADLAHLNEWAIEYIFTRFLETFGSSETINFMQNAVSLLKTINHQSHHNKIKGKELANWENFRQELLKKV